MAQSPMNGLVTPAKLKLAADRHVDYFVEPHRPELMNLLEKKLDYVHLFIPTAMAATFSKILDERSQIPSKACAPILISDAFDSVDVEPDDDFISEFSSFMSMLTEILQKFKAEDLSADWEQERFLKFKALRNKMNHWFTTCQNLKNRLKYDRNRNDDLIKVGVRFSPTIRSDLLKEQCSKRINDLKNTLESELTDEMKKYAIDCIKTLKSFIYNNLKDDEDLVVIARAFRSTLMKDTSLAKEYLHFIPKSNKFNFKPSAMKKVRINDEMNYSDTQRQLPVGSSRDKLRINDEMKYSDTQRQLPVAPRRDTDRQIDRSRGNNADMNKSDLSTEDSDFTLRTTHKRRRTEHSFNDRTQRVVADDSDSEHNRNPSRFTDRTFTPSKGVRRNARYAVDSSYDEDFPAYSNKKKQFKAKYSDKLRLPSSKNYSDGRPDYRTDYSDTHWV
jgi:hypothetical protein